MGLNFIQNRMLAGRHSTTRATRWDTLLPPPQPASSHEEDSPARCDCAASAAVARAARGAGAKAGAAEVGAPAAGGALGEALTRVHERAGRGGLHECVRGAGTRTPFAFVDTVHEPCILPTSISQKDNLISFCHTNFFRSICGENVLF